jgi:zinc and cadmium transporter
VKSRTALIATAFLALLFLSGDCRALTQDAESTAAEVIRTSASDRDLELGSALFSEQPRATVSRGYVWFLTFVYCSLIVMASVGGGLLPSVVRLTHTHMQTVISFVGGLMLGIAVFHLFPHALHGNRSVDSVAWWMMAGIVTMFLMIRFFHFHHHGPLEISTEKEDPCAGHDHVHEHDRDHTKPHCHHAHELSWIGIATGLSVHTLIDGMALAASIQAESSHRTIWSLFGIGTFLAIMLHKPLDAVSITSLMAGSGWTARSRLLVNLGFACMCPLGALMFMLGASQLQALHADFLSAALGFSAGVFLCISLSDLLPEMEFHAHNRFGLTTALLAGILLAYGITFLEPANLH